MKYLKEFILREIAGEAVLVPVGKTAQEFNGMLNLTETAKVIWENYEKVDSLEEMIKIITDSFEVDEELARKDVIGFTSVLLQKGLIGLTKEDGTW